MSRYAPPRLSEGPPGENRATPRGFEGRGAEKPRLDGPACLWRREGHLDIRRRLPDHEHGELLPQSFAGKSGRCAKVRGPTSVTVMSTANLGDFRPRGVTTATPACIIAGVCRLFQEFFGHVSLTARAGALWLDQSSSH